MTTTYNAMINVLADGECRVAECLGAQTHTELIEAMLKDLWYYAQPEYAQGREITFRLEGPVTRDCDTCLGQGTVPKAHGFARKKCPVCKGHNSSVPL